ncbi:hypothetical protein [Massilimicrobiota sp. An134]|uniref:hypothetical protein n=1 Tax=Massilimicrobiota sp. An134 TaxID=1965557 RepID=UPI001302917D|nr:hypothetical protein [Massilimicrobiota sp. An134]
MKFMKKKVLGLVVSIAMVLSLFVLPVSVNAANEKVAKMIILLKLTNHSDYADQLFQYP